MRKRNILIVEDEVRMQRILEVNLRDKYNVLLASNGEEALNIVKGNDVNLILTDMKMPRKDGISLLHDVKEFAPDIPVILITAYGTIESAVRAMKEGAYDYILKPLKMDEIEVVVEKALSHARLIDENRSLREELKATYGFDNIISINPKMSLIMELVGQIADSKATILLQGESGTGKELVARAIHYNSQRSRGPFIVVNCSAIPRELLESELFGYEKGAFTGATRLKLGSFELADTGTLFLDEIGEMEKELQVKILRALEGYGFMRIGGTENIEVDVRVITATNRDLKGAVEMGDFREDLYYRLNVVCINLPPLKERREDIPLLATHFMEKYRGEGKSEVSEISDEAIKLLERYHWPGNVRELENCILRGMVLAKTGRIEVRDLPEEVVEGALPAEERTPRNTQQLKHMKKREKERVVGKIEKQFIIEALRRNKGNISRSATDVGMDRRQFQNMIKKYRVFVEDYRNRG
ncbi:MAG: sigma-54-dependent Fis family transcriptional regulator [Syntrophobacterales bacterium]|nr:MAG: sigma-54-dependent Fis family transcriptional regulator [Syntrophobacterales bacterium]